MEDPDQQRWQEDVVRHPKGASGQRGDDAQTRDEAAEENGEHPTLVEPGLDAGQPRAVTVEVAPVAIQQRPPTTSAKPVEQGRAYQRGQEQEDEDPEQVDLTASDSVAGQHHRHITGHGQRDAGLLDENEEHDRSFVVTLDELNQEVRQPLPPVHRWLLGMDTRWALSWCSASHMPLPTARRG